MGRPFVLCAAGGRLMVAGIVCEAAALVCGNLGGADALGSSGRRDYCIVGIVPLARR